ncbi:MAG: trehalose-phosphatase [Nitriliruptoraceae bacterium]
MNLPLADPTELADAIGKVDRFVVVLDFDGTLAPIVDHPDDAALGPGAFNAITRLAARTPVVISSGRHLEDLRDRLEGLAVLLVGGHGAEVGDHDQTIVQLVDAGSVVSTLDAIEERLHRLVGAAQGWIIERKPTSLAVHYRLAANDDVRALLPRIRALLDERRHDPPGFALMEGKQVVEMRPRGSDKGQALEWLLDAYPGKLPLVIGDDVTDEDAFAVAEHHRGIGIFVSEIDRPTQATERLRSPASVVAFLDRLAELQAED